MSTSVTIRHVKIDEDYDQIDDFFHQLYCYKNWWWRVLLHGTFRLFSWQIGLCGLVLGGLSQSMCGQILWAPIFGLLLLMVILGLKKLRALMNLFKNSGNFVKDRLEVGDTFLVATIDGRIVGVVGIKWLQEVRTLYEVERIDSLHFPHVCIVLKSAFSILHPHQSLLLH